MYYIIVYSGLLDVTARVTDYAAVKTGLYQINPGFRIQPIRVECGSGGTKHAIGS